jgi:hypothetical protein
LGKIGRFLRANMFCLPSVAIITAVGRYGACLIGSRAACGNCGWPGAIDDVAIWNRDLQEDEIETLFEFGIGGPPPVGCDLTGDGLCDTLDVDQLMQEVASGNENTEFDLTADGMVNDADRDDWLADAAAKNRFAEPYLLGDANLDGVNDAADLNALALNWQDANTNTWSGGNFTGAGVDAADLNALALGWQQSISAAGAAAVPEPASLCCWRGRFLVRLPCFNDKRTLSRGRRETPTHCGTFRLNSLRTLRPNA